MFLWQYLTLLLLTTVQICKAEECAEFTDLKLAHAIIGTSIRVRLLLYTKENATCGTLLSHSNLSAHPQFLLTRPTTFIVHGYRPSGSPPIWINPVRELLLERADLNVIVVDWNHGAANVNYMKAVENTRKTAANLTAFIQKMKNNGASLSSIHMIGVSLGAHISGFVGANFNGTIGRITALDPAGPLFTGKSEKDRLDLTDAQFVDALHTDIDALGFREPLGHIDFYANGGTDQPGCPRTIFSGGSYFKCDHQRSVLLFIDSLNRTCSSRAFPCDSYKDFLDGKCLKCDQFGSLGCPVFGYNVTQWKDILQKLGQTKTYFSTTAQSPFCKTNYMLEVMIWNKEERWGYLTVKLHGNGKEAVATIDHKESMFRKFTETKLLAQFDQDIQSVEKMSLKFSTNSVCEPKRKLRVLRARLTRLDGNEKRLCRYDVLLAENKEVIFKPLPCEDNNF
ncbi:lipase member H [Mugil cephalus]|uniref:lipase member H n=1 Tax=Mugil cephalus TaxID=48193 RepID=UPI001FB78A55|nr:lipase member H [Mugil cephalus]XP_047462512.1 lipase member H [Mugil cephalus]XP_047462513.1 lipase member H [Mugil cephalus]